MNSQELENFSLGDAVKFHDSLNPALFQDDKMLPQVREQLLAIARDFIEHLGIKNVEVRDITLSGSNAAFTYTPHSDVDIHILVDMDRYANDEVYRELFNSKKVIYNDSHDIKIHGYDVELYVQDTAEPVKSLGEYSIERDRWIKFPSKTRANLDERATREKFKRLVQLSQLALDSDDVDDVDKLLNTVKRYRQAGLDEHGEFGPENLAYKALRSRGIVQQLYDRRDKLHADTFTLSENEPDEYAPPGVPDADVIRIRREIQQAMKKNEPLVWKRARDLSVSIPDAQLQKYGLRKHPETGNWAGRQSQWDKFYADYNLREVINTEIVKPDFHAEKQIDIPGVGPLTLRARNLTTTPPEQFIVDVIKPDGFNIGYFRFVVHDNVPSKKFKFFSKKSDPYLVAGKAAVWDEYQKRGIATAVYRWLERELGNDLRPSSMQSDQGRALWRSLNRDLNTEDYDPNGPPPGPEFKPTMPAGTVRVDVSDVYDWYKLGQHISDMGGLGKHDFGKGPPSTIMAFGDEDLEHKYIDALKKTGLDTTDIDPVDPKQPKGIKRQKTDPTFNVGVAESASGYIPSNAERDDPRFKTALTVDVKPDSIKKNAKKLGLGNIHRSGIPQTARSDGKFR